jgi:hypothetical protein
MDVSVIPGSVTWKFKLEILDPKTRIVLWTVYEPVKIILFSAVESLKTSNL